MLIIGAGGLAKDILNALEKPATVAFFDDVTNLSALSLSGAYRIIRNGDEASVYFSETGPEFVLGIGKPTVRQALADKFTGLGGRMSTFMGRHALVGDFETFIGDGCTILPYAIVSNASRLGKGCLVHHSAVVSHDCVVGDFCELSPGAILLGHVTVGDLTHIGANATIIPGVKIGAGCRIAAGSVVNKKVPDGKIVAGNPARAISSPERQS